jgi:hypothetical protein
MSKAIPQPPEPGKPGFFIGTNGDLKGMVVTATEGHSRRMVWYLKGAKPGPWILETWWEIDGIETEMVEPPVSIEAATWEFAKEEAKAILKARRKHAIETLAALRAQGQLPPKPFDGLSGSEQERITDAWEMANKPMWPNLFSLSRDEKDKARIAAAITADLLGMGFREFVTLEIAKMTARTGDLDRLNVWLVENWFHGEKLASRTPKERLKIAKEAGHSATQHGLGMRLTRLALTARSKRE